MKSNEYFERWKNIMIGIIKMITLFVWMVVGLLAIATICVSCSYIKWLLTPAKNLWIEENEDK
jgi:hypothetical protein